MSIIFLTYAINHTILELNEYKNRRGADVEAEEVPENLRLSADAVLCAGGDAGKGGDGRSQSGGI